MANLYTPDGDDSASFVSLPRYSMVGGILMEDFATANMPQSDISEFRPLNLATLPGYSNPHRVSSLSPRYTTVFGPLGEQGSGPSNSEPPLTPRIQKEHVFHLTNGKKAWATLTVFSSASSSTNAPKFYGGDDISGSFSLDLDSSQHIQAIKLSVKGRIFTTGHSEDGSFTFLDESAILWSKAIGDPHIPEGQSNDKKTGGPLTAGQYSWSFSFKFPTQATLSSGGVGAPHLAFQIPQTFTEKGASVTVRYDLILHISRGKLRADQRIRTPIIYVPKIVPEPPSIPRQLAYRDNSPLSGPGSDPDGWFTLPPTVIHGEMFSRHIRVECSLFLANPLCYTRGTVIPCSLLIGCVDSQALDLLSSPNAITVCLQRRIKYFPNNVHQAAKRRSYSASAAQHSVEDIAIATAKWWSPPKDSLLRADERRVEGEIHLPRDMQPTSNFVHFVVEYSVNLLNFASPVFSQTGQETIITSRSVSIATFRTPGPTPRAYTVRRSPIPQASTFERVQPVGFLATMAG